MFPDPSLIGLLIATLGGTAVGLERQWSGHADGPSARFGGIRTFSMLGAIAGISGWLINIGLPLVAITLLAGAVLIVVSAYVAASRQEIDATTEVAALIVLSSGVLAGIGWFALASSIIALTTLLLVEKSRLHSLVARIDDVSLRAGMRFGVMALVVLPVLPAGPYGPLGGIRPRELWALVLFFSGLSFVGYVARQIAGPRHGYLVTGLLGGIVSSTNVTFTFARLSRDHRSAERELAWGAAAANAMLFPRVLVAVAVLNPSLVAWLAPYLVAPAFIAIAITVIGLRGSTEPNDGTPQRGNPLQLGHALQMTVLFQLVLTSVHLAGQFWGTSGVMATAAVLGLTDVDALTMSMARDVASSMSPGVAAPAIAIGITTNTLLKAALALVFGTPAFRLVTVTFLLAIGGALAVPLVF